MPEKRLIDANAFIEFLKRKTSCTYPNKFPGLMEAIDFVKNFPAVDAVEVVRCEDCRFCRTFFPEKQIGKEATQVWYCDLYRCKRKTDEYCSDGERREKGNNGC